MELSERKREVLFAVVENYIVTAEPVGSAQIAKAGGLSVSPATVRHVMAELEEMGLILRPHTSAGGVPTDLAYRFYVDRLMQLKPLTSGVQDEIRNRVETGAATVSDILKETCKLISVQTHQPGMIVSPRADETRLKHIQFVRLKNNLALGVLVTSSGIVENKVLELSEPYTQEQLNQMHNFLNERIAGRAVSEVRREILLEMKQAHQNYDRLLSQALILGERTMAEEGREVHVEGQSLLFDEPEFSNARAMQGILRTLEEKNQVLALLDQAIRNPGVKILIGEEIHCGEVNGLSLITSTYSDAEGNRGVLGVIGPTRLDYARIVPLVEFTSQMVTDTLGQRSE